MASEYVSILVGDNWHGESKFRDALKDLSDLFFGMFMNVRRMWAQLLDRDFTYLANEAYAKPSHEREPRSS